MKKRRQRELPFSGRMLVVFAILGFLAIVGLVLGRVLQETSPFAPTPVPDPSPTSTVVADASPTMGPESTPIATFDPEPPAPIGSLPDLLRYSPDRLADDSLPLSDVAQYADIARWMEARGVAIPEGIQDDRFAAWNAELRHLALPNVLATRGVDAVWRDTYGFDLTNIHHVLSVGQAPDFVWIMRGDFDVDAMQAAWVEAGYQAVRLDGVTVWSLYPGDSVDLSSPASRPALGNMNNVVVLEDGTLIASARLPRLEQTLQTIAGTRPALIDNPRIAALIAPGTKPEDLATAVIVKGSLLVSEPVASPMADNDATPVPAEIPQAGLMLAGLERPSSRYDAPVLSLVLAYDSADDATAAALRASDVLRDQSSPLTNRPYAERFDIVGIWVLATSADETLLHMHLHTPQGANDWLSIIDERDLGFVMWPWEP